MVKRKPKFKVGDIVNVSEKHRKFFQKTGGVNMTITQVKWSPTESVFRYTISKENMDPLEEILELNLGPW